MAVIEQLIIKPSLFDGIVIPEDDIQQDPEAITDASGLSQVHTEVYNRGMPNKDGSATLIHEDDPSFEFVVGYFESGQYVKLGNNGVSTLVYVIREGRVWQHVSKGDTLLPDAVDITDNTGEIAAVAGVMSKGK